MTASWRAGSNSCPSDAIGSAFGLQRSKKLLERHLEAVVQRFEALRLAGGGECRSKSSMMGSSVRMSSRVANCLS